MKDVIRLLPESLANQIAAGEVVQRPASVVKELLENSIDAGASEITLLVKDAGKSLIQVLDNGKGMSVTDARMCFERHATSKIANTEDLFNIRTYGFRGEALASIAAVAQVELKTKRAADEVGTKILIEDSKVISQEATACPNGTQISVKNLFFNVPARRNFLKSNTAEWRQILDEFVRVALAYPQVSLSLYHNDEEIHQLAAQTHLAKRIVAVLGKSYQSQLIPVDQSIELIKVKGYLGKPENAKKTRGEQFLYVNQRFVKHNFLNHAVFSAYQGILAKDSFPFFYLNIEIEPVHVDINVHPTKTEVKFDDENFVYNFLRTCVQKSLSTLGIASAIDFSLDVNYMSKLSTPAPKDKPSSGSAPAKPNSSAQYWERLYPQAEPEATQLTLKGLDNIPSQPQKWQALYLKNKYLLTPLRSGVALIDLLSAFQRIEYEKAMAAFGEMAASQAVAFPVRLELDAADAELLTDRLIEFNSLGFEIEPLGKGSFALTGLPSDWVGSETELIYEILEQIKTHEQKNLPFREKLARAYCKRVAWRKLKNFLPEQAEQVAQKLLACQAPNYSPEGQKALLVVTYEEIEAMLK
jgi:DNA mismatch repair protein MutL